MQTRYSQFKPIASAKCNGAQPAPHSCCFQRHATPAQAQLSRVPAPHYLQGLRCNNCGVGGPHYPPHLWRRHPRTSERLCHACYGYSTAHGGAPRPEALVWRQRNRWVGSRFDTLACRAVRQQAPICWLSCPPASVHQHEQHSQHASHSLFTCRWLELARPNDARLQCCCHCGRPPKGRMG